VGTHLRQVGGKIAKATSPPDNLQRFAEVAQAFLDREQKRLKKSSWIRECKAVTSLVRYFGESLMAHSIDENCVRRFVRERAKSLSPSSVSLELHILKQICVFAVAMGFLQENPAKSVRAPAIPDTHPRAISKEEFAKIVQACPDWLQPLIELSAAAGLRRAEVLSLRWCDVNDTEGTLTVRSTKRTVLLSKSARRALHLARKRQIAPSATIFGGPRFTEGNVSQTFLRVCRSLGIEDLSLKDIRIMSANWMAADGIDIATIASFLGIKSIREVAKYVKRSESNLADALQSIDSRMIGATDSRYQRKRMTRM
jgi:integrase